jgi:hypothetical protein
VNISTAFVEQVNSLREVHRKLARAYGEALEARELAVSAYNFFYGELYRNPGDGLLGPPTKFTTLSFGDANLRIDHQQYHLGVGAHILPLLPFEDRIDEHGGAVVVYRDDAGLQLSA